MLMKARVFPALKGRGPYHQMRDMAGPPRSSIAMLSRVIDSLLIVGGLWLLTFIYAQRWNDYYTQAMVWAVGLFFFFAQTQDLYRSWRGASMRQETVRIWVAWLTVSLGLLFLAFVTKKTGEFSREVILSWFALVPLLLTLWRGVMLVLVGYLRERDINTRTVAIVGARELGADLARTILESPWMGLRPIGFFDDRARTGARPLVDEPVQVVGNLNHLVKLAGEGNIDLIYITLPLRAEERIRELIAKLSDTTASVYMVPDCFVSDLMGATWSNVGELPTVSVFETPFYGVDGWVKRVEDFILASLILLIAAVPMLLIALGIKLTSPGPILFKQYRYGLRGDKFEVWKFRTMSVCEDGDDIKQATKCDTRVTGFGAFLRKTSLDELPQFINVLQGSMSIVGPRPHAVVHNEQYRKLINGYMLRHKVKPGITGLAQINGLRGETDTLDKMQQRVECDLAYIRHWSLWLDLKIIFMTALRGFIGQNAY